MRVVVGPERDGGPELGDGIRGDVVRVRLAVPLVVSGVRLGDVRARAGLVDGGAR